MAPEPLLQFAHALKWVALGVLLLNLLILFVR